MIDAEIYVDRNAESAIQSMNSYLESLRTSLLEEADADPEDLWMRTLKAGQIDEDEYFGHVINTDMMEILRSIREEQKTDKTTVDTTVAAEMEKAVQEAKNLHGTPKEKAIKVLCSRLGIQYDDFMSGGELRAEVLANYLRHERLPDCTFLPENALYQRIYGTLPEGGVIIQQSHKRSQAARSFAA